MSAGQLRWVVSMTVRRNDRLSRADERHLTWLEATAGGSSRDGNAMRGHGPRGNPYLSDF